MALLDDVLQTLGNAIRAVIEPSVGEVVFTNQKEITILLAPGQVIRGNPLITELADILSPGDGQWQIQLWPMRPRRAVRSSPFDKQTQIATPGTSPLSVVQTLTTLAFTLSGPISASLNVHTVFEDLGDAYVQAVPGDTADSIATKVCNAINALDLSGTSATVDANIVTITTNLDFVCNIGAPGTLAYMAGQFTRPIQIIVWASDPYTRSFLEEAIEENVGTTLTPPFLVLPNGSGMRVLNDNISWDDDSQRDGSLYLGHLMYTVWYAQMVSTPTAPVGVVKLLTSGPKSDSGTIYVGGSS